MIELYVTEVHLKPFPYLITGRYIEHEVGRRSSRQLCSEADQGHSGLPDENFNKKPNGAKKRSEKGSTDCLTQCFPKWGKVHPGANMRFFEGNA